MLYILKKRKEWIGACICIYVRNYLKMIIEGFQNVDWNRGVNLYRTGRQKGNQKGEDENPSMFPV